MVNFLKIAIGAVIALTLPATYAAAAPYTMLTAPDAISRSILARPLMKLDEGAPAGVDASPTIHQNFPQIIEQNFARLNAVDAKALVDNLSEKELDDLARLYVTATADTGHADRLLPVLAGKLDSTRLVRLSHHFGFAPVYTAIVGSVPTLSTDFVLAARVSDLAPIPHAALIGSTSSGSTGPTANFGSVIKYWNWTPQEIYLDLRTAPIGALSRLGAFVETFSVINKAITIAWAGGQTIGTVTNWLLQTYAPELYTTIGGTVSEIYNQYLNATTLITQGQYVAGMCAAVGVSAAQTVPMSTSNGDYGSTENYTDFTDYTSGSACPRGQKCPTHPTE